MKYLYANINDYNDNDYKSIYESINNFKKKDIDKLPTIDDKKRSILGIKLLMNLLSEKSINYNDLKFTKNKDGKPIITNYSLFYSTSHSDKYVICAISDTEIGIDIQSIQEINFKIMNSFFNEDEKLYSNNNENYTKILSLKESYGKCYGFGINHIKEVKFSIKGKNIIINDKSVTYKFINEIPNYIISIVEKTC